MKALSIRQPWAFAILHLGKGIENRSRRLAYTGPLAIHAGRSVDEEAVRTVAEIARSQGMDYEAALVANGPLRVGGVIGIVDMIDCIDDRDYRAASPWFFGPYGYVLARPRTVPFLPWRGQLGLFEIDETLIPGLTSAAREQGSLL